MSNSLETTVDYDALVKEGRQWVENNDWSPTSDKLDEALDAIEQLRQHLDCTIDMLKQTRTERDAALNRVEQLEIAQGPNMLDRARSEAFPVIAKECDELRTRCEALESAIRSAMHRDNVMMSGPIPCGCPTCSRLRTAIAAREVPNE